MNFRVIFVIFIVLAFTFGLGTLSYSISGGMPIKKAYDEGKVQIIQNTTAGTVPHVVMVKNNGADSVKVEEGDLLLSETSQNLVVAEDKKILPESSVQVKAYCFEPDQSAKSGSKLTASGKASVAIQDIIANSDSTNSVDAYKTQLQIWVIVGKGEVNPYLGEAPKLIDKQGISFTELRQNISDAKMEVMSYFNVKSEEIGNLNQDNSQTTIELIQNWVNDISNWLRDSLGI